MEHADRFLRRFYIEKGMFGSLSLTFIFYRPPLKLDGLLRTEGHMPLLYALHGTTTPRMSVYTVSYTHLTLPTNTVV